MWKYITVLFKFRIVRIPYVQKFIGGIRRSKFYDTSVKCWGYKSVGKSSDKLTSLKIKFQCTPPRPIECVCVRVVKIIRFDEFGWLTEGTRMVKVTNLPSTTTTTTTNEHILYIAIRFQVAFEWEALYCLTKKQPMGNKSYFCNNNENNNNNKATQTQKGTENGSVAKWRWMGGWMEFLGNWWAKVVVLGCRGLNTKFKKFYVRGRVCKLTDALFKVLVFCSFRLLPTSFFRSLFFPLLETFNISSFSLWLTVGSKFELVLFLWVVFERLCT